MQFQKFKKFLKSFKTIDLLYHPIRLLRKSLQKKTSIRSLHRKGPAVLKEFITICRSLDVDVWLCFGSLLGAIRDNGFIGHDDDIDVGIRIAHNSQALRDALAQAGFQLLRRFHVDDGTTALEYTYLKDGVKIDVFFHFGNGQNLWCHFFYVERPEDVETGAFLVRKLDFPDRGLSDFSLFGMSIQIPLNFDEYLRLHYGPTYMTPDPNFNWRNGPKKDSLLPGVIGRLENFKAR